MTNLVSVKNKSTRSKDENVPAQLRPLLAAEAQILKSVGEGLEIDVSHISSKRGESEEAFGLIRADFFAWLITDAAVARQVNLNGRLSLKGAQVQGTIRIAFRSIPIDLHLIDCIFDSAFVASFARTKSLEFERCTLQAFGLTSATVDGSIALDGVSVVSHLQMHGATIGGALSINGSVIKGVGNTGVNASNISVRGNLSVISTEINGCLRMLNASVNGDLEVQSTTIRSRGPYTIHADGIKIGGRCFINNGCQMFGITRFMGSKIGGELNLIASRFSDAVAYPWISGAPSFLGRFL